MPTQTLGCSHHNTDEINTLHTVYIYVCHTRTAFSGTLFFALDAGKAIWSVQVPLALPRHLKQVCVCVHNLTLNVSIHQSAPACIHYR